MKITIDTKEDSAEEIKKMIGLLSSLVEQTTPDRDISEKPNLSQENVLGNIFDVNKETEEGPPEAAEPKAEEEEAEIQMFY